MSEIRVTATYEPRDHGWIATVTHGESTLAAHGRTLDKARANLAAQLARVLKTYAGSIAIDDDIVLSAEAIGAVGDARHAKDAALRAAAESNLATDRAVRALEAEGLSLRDIGYLLGLSHSRVHQVLGKIETTKGKSGG